MRLQLQVPGRTAGGGSLFRGSFFSIEPTLCYSHTFNDIHVQNVCTGHIAYKRYECTMTLPLRWEPGERLRSSRARNSGSLFPAAGLSSPIFARKGSSIVGGQASVAR